MKIPIVHGNGRTWVICNGLLYQPAIASETNRDFWPWFGARWPIKRFIVRLSINEAWSEVRSAKDVWELI